MYFLSNNQYKYLLRLVKNRHFRKKEGKVLIQGDKVVTELAKHNPDCIEYIVLTRQTQNKYKKFDKFLIKESGVDRLSNKKSGFTVAALINVKNNTTAPKNLSGVSLGLVNIQDPFNLGTIYRTAEAFGIKNIFLFNNSVSPYHQKVIDTSLASIFRVTTAELDTIEEFKDLYPNIEVVASTPKAEKSYKEYTPQNTLLLFGNEGNGLSKEYVAASNEKIKIPIKSIDSVNVAVSVGIILAHYMS